MDNIDIKKEVKKTKQHKFTRKQKPKKTDDEKQIIVKIERNPKPILI
jgi:hypothetical protein